MNHFFWDRLWSSALWFLLTLMMLTTALVFIQKIAPKLIDWLGAFCNWMVQKPILGVATMCAYAIVVIGVSSIAFGTFDFNMQKLFGMLGKLMKVRQERFIMEFSFFFLGAGFAKAGLTTNQSLLSKIGLSWHKWFGLALISGVAYITYSITNFYDGAYSLEIARHFYFGNGWDTVWPLIDIYGGAILIRTTLMGVFMIALTGMYVAIFQRFLDIPHPKWQSLAVCSFGIYLFHEPIVCMIHYGFYNADISTYIKFFVTASVATIVPWALTHALRPLPGFKKSL